jgi:hypothetical protein
MVPAEAQLLVEHLEEDPQDGVAPVGGIGLAVDVEQADIDGGADGALDSAASMASWILPSKNAMARRVCPA